MATDSALHSKEAVLDAAHHLLIQHGYAGLSMRELAQQSGLAKGTIYHHFPDKRAIYLSVLERDLGVARDRIQAAAGSDGDYVARLRSVIAVYFQLYIEQRVGILTAMRDAGLEPQVSALVRRYRSDMLRPIEAIFEAAISAGAMRPVNVEMTVMSLLGILQSFVVHHFLLDDPYNGAEVVDYTLDLLLHGLLTPRQGAASTHNTQPL